MKQAAMMDQWSPVCSSPRRLRLTGAVAKSYRVYVERAQRGEGRTGDHPQGVAHKRPSALLASLDVTPLCLRVAA